MKRFDFEMFGDDPQFEERPDGDWVSALDALEMQEENKRLEEAAREQRVRADEFGHRLTAALSKLREWVNFDFDSPEERDGDEDGSALERLCSETCALLRKP